MEIGHPCRTLSSQKGTAKILFKPANVLFYDMQITTDAASSKLGLTEAEGTPMARIAGYCTDKSWIFRTRRSVCYASLSPVPTCGSQRVLILAQTWSTFIFSSANYSCFGMSMAIKSRTTLPCSPLMQPDAINISARSLTCIVKDGKTGNFQLFSLSIRLPDTDTRYPSLIVL